MRQIATVLLATQKHGLLPPTQRAHRGRRETKFSDSQLGVQRRRFELRERHLAVSERNRLRDGALQSGCAVGVYPRAAEDRKRRWIDMKRRAKEYENKNNHWYNIIVRLKEVCATICSLDSRKMLLFTDLAAP